MKLTVEEAREIVFGDSEDWDEVPDTVETIGHSRWSIDRVGIFLHKPSNKYYEFNWRVGATEMQDERPFEYEKEVEPVEVEFREVTKKEWVAV